MTRLKTKPRMGMALFKTKGWKPMALFRRIFLNNNYLGHFLIGEPGVFPNRAGFPALLNRIGDRLLCRYEKYFVPSIIIFYLAPSL